MIYRDVQQGSSEWLRARLGIPTASEFDKLLTPKTLKLSAQSEDLMNRLIAERLTGTPFNEEVRIWTTSMEDGLAREQESVELYELITGEQTSLCGFCLTDDGRVGCSPDRWIGDREALFEAKNPMAKTHVKWLRAGQLPEEHVLQCQGQLWVTGLDRHVWMSYFPALPPLIVESQPDPRIQDALSTALETFLTQLDLETQRLEALRP